MASSGGAASVLLARLLLLALNLTLFGLGVTLLVMGTKRSHYSGLMSSIYAHGGLTVAIFEEPDAALMITGMFLTVVSLKVRHATRRDSRRHETRLPKHTTRRTKSFSAMLGAKTEKPPNAFQFSPPSPLPLLPTGLPGRVHGREAGAAGVPPPVHLSVDGRVALTPGCQAGYMDGSYWLSSIEWCVLTQNNAVKSANPTWRGSCTAPR
jgi:hypothetical protein